MKIKTPFIGWFARFSGEILGKREFSIFSFVTIWRDVWKLLKYSLFSLWGKDKPLIFHRKVNQYTINHKCAHFPLAVL